jgi:hypothetical protein
MTTERTDIILELSRNLSEGRTEPRAVAILRDWPVQVDPRHGGQFVRLPGIATCDGYRALRGNVAEITDRELAAIARKVRRFGTHDVTWLQTARPEVTA